LRVRIRKKASVACCEQCLVYLHYKFNIISFGVNTEGHSTLLHTEHSPRHVRGNGCKSRSSPYRAAVRATLSKRMKQDAEEGAREAKETEENEEEREGNEEEK
jgi:hypothetical protein